MVPELYLQQAKLVAAYRTGSLTPNSRIEAEDLYVFHLLPYVA